MAVIAPHWLRAPRFPLIRIFKGNRRFAPCNPDYAPKMRPRLRACLCRLLHFICAGKAFLRRSASIPHPSRMAGVCSARACLLSVERSSSCNSANLFYLVYRSLAEPAARHLLSAGVCSARACITCYILSSCQVMMKNPARSHTACSFACIFCFHVVYIVAGKHIPASSALVSDFMTARWQTIAAAHMYDRRAVVSFSAVGGRKV